MSLTTFCLICLSVDVVILIIGLFVEAEIQYRRRKVKQVRELHAENAILRAEIRRQAFGSEWELDKVKTELALKELLLRQKWAGVKK